MTTLFAATETALCAIFVVARQAVSWLSTGQWDPYSITALMRELGVEIQSRYVTASSSSERSSEVWRDLLELPTAAVLFLVFILFLVLHQSLRLLGAKETR
jgi:hypothetical protein